MVNFTRYQLPLFIWAILIYWISSIETLPHVEIPIISPDKLAHVGVYFIFCWFSRRALYFQVAVPFLKRWSFVGAFLLTCLYGYLDEVHQLYVPGRSYEYYDMLADAIGALLFLAFFAISKRWQERRTSSG